MKFYHVKTQEDYDALMLELETKDYKWREKANPTTRNKWINYKEKTYVKVEGILTYGNIEDSYQEKYSNYPIIEYKAAEMAVEEKHGKN